MKHISVIVKNLAAVAGAFFCGYYFTLFFHEPTSLIGGMWAVISAIIVNESTSQETYYSARNRIIGSLIGAIISGVYLLLFPFSIIGYILTIGVGVMLCLLLGTYLQHPTLQLLAFRLMY